jgi:hypothetical protein
MAMSKKSGLAAAFILFFSLSLVADAGLVGLASANPNPAPPSAKSPEPLISCLSPSNETYNSNKVPLIVNISNADPTALAQCKLDGQIKCQFYGSNLLNLNLVGLSEGFHQLEIHVYYHQIGIIQVPSMYPPYAEQPVPMEKLLFVSFTVASFLPSPSPSLQPSITPSPSPTVGPTVEPALAPTLEPTLEPASAPKHQIGFLGTNLPVEYGYAILAGLVMVVVAGLSLVYFKKLRK